MSNTQKRNETRIMYNIIIAILILVIVVSSCMGIFAWAKYTSSINGTATAQVAKWSFKLVDGVTETTDVIDFAITRTDGYGKVVEGRLAPGTFGEFEIGIDARGTETILEYVINVELENKPTYLKLYSDEAKTQEILVEDNKFSVKGFMSLEDVEEIRTETIYWDWPYENGDDGQDTQDAGKLVTMKVSVTGYEVLEPSAEEDDITYPVNLAEVVKVGDYVNYDANSGLTQPVTYTKGEYTFSSSDNLKWRVLSVDKEKGNVELTSADPTSSRLYLDGRTGYTAAENILNNIGAIYGQGKGAKSGRSINLKDIEQYSSYDPYTYAKSHSSTGFYGGTKTYSSSDGGYFVDIGDGSVIIETESGTGSKKYIAKQTYYEYSAKDYFENETIYNMLFRNSANTGNRSVYWLASRGVDLYESWVCFRLFEVSPSGSVSGSVLARSNWSGGNESYGCVQPVVSLKTNIQTIGKDENGVWQLKVD